MDNVIDIVEEDAIKVRQAKYAGGFQHKLETSQQLVNEMAGYLLAKNVYVRKQDDATPFKDKFGRTLRLWDAEAVCGSSRFAFDAKDFARLGRYDVTGLPQKYVDERLKVKDQGRGLFVVFRDNMEWVTQRAKAWKISNEKVLSYLEKDGFAKKTEKGWYFVPYGNELSFLMQEENRWIEREKEDPNSPRNPIRSHLSKYRGALQYLWKMKAMLPLDKMIDEKILKNECSRDEVS